MRWVKIKDCELCGCSGVGWGMELVGERERFKMVVETLNDLGRTSFTVSRI